MKIVLERRCMCLGCCIALLLSSTSGLAEMPPPKTEPAPLSGPEDGQQAATDTNELDPAQTLTAESPANTSSVSDVSATSVPKKLRDPFWPPGYSPDTAAKETAQKKKGQKEKKKRLPEWDKASKLLTIKGVMKIGANTYAAIVKDDVVRENDTISVTYQNRRYTWKVRCITKTGVQFGRVGVE